ncbi:MAG: GNAT family N-acetyltransferase [Betaproteobacteria bacterium]|nr:GNAT family N-acetyltransferase [Betaproteobacteria bacterium]
MIKQISNINMDIYFELSDLYEEEFAPLTGAKRNGNGHYPVSTPINKTHIGYIIFNANEKIGFIVINIEKEPYDICEFFILKKYRNQGLGQRLAFTVFDAHNVNWSVKQLYNAEQARAFWIKVISKYTEDNYTEQLYEDKKWGKVYIQLFSSKEKCPCE